MRVLRLLVFVGLVFSAAESWAEDADKAAPPAGTWARYHVVIKGEEGAEQTGEMMLKFLGSEQRDGQACRWVEIRWKFEDFRQIEQYLATEKSLRESRLPLHESLKGRVQNDGGEWIDLSPPNCTGPSYLLFTLPGARQAAEKIEEPQTIEYQRGRLTAKLCYRTVQRNNPKLDRMEYTVWPHPDVPAGHIRLRIRGTAGEGDAIRTWSREDTLQDFGREEIENLRMQK